MIQCNSNFEYQISKISNEQCNICRSLSKPNGIVGVYPCSFSYNLVYEIKADPPIRGHQVCKEIWAPQKDDILCCKKDSEALDLDKHTVDIYKEDRLVIELTRIISYFFKRVKRTK